MLDRLAGIVGAAHVSADPDVLAARSVDWTGRYRGRATLLVRPGDAGEVAAVLRACRDAGIPVTVQGGRTSLVAGTVPEHDDVLLSTERLTAMGAVDPTARTLTVAAGVTLAAAQHAAAEAGLRVGVDLASRDSATIGGMASTNAGGLRTVRYGNMAEQVLGLQVALPDGSLLRRHPKVRCDNTGYDLTRLFVGAEGTLGVITEVDLRLHHIPPHRIVALCGFADLEDLLVTARRLGDLETVAALELIDGGAAALAADHFGLPVPVTGAWLLLVELAGNTDQGDLLTSVVNTALDTLTGEPAVGVDAAGMQRLWRVREALAEVVGLFGPPLKFDVALPIPAVAAFTAQAAAITTRIAPGARAVLFGHIGEGNLHLNLLGCSAGQESAIYPEMMALIAAHGGNVSSEHGVGSRKRAYLSMSREPTDIAVMRSIRATLDPTGFLNPAVLFD
ncbi:MAG TPA: FAD-binding oxidoreductase [Mycobacterium sp.]|nr:FAD-binding oxidoreductase [Mycobacterium sp.]HPZ95356.1 FAD-binding oxidoreductase [Mycobacterium sp.]HQE15094.1 FAD-binding oxidoreductase [Mycobacterium sp.]